MDNFETITIQDENGNETEATLVLAYKNEELNKEYLLFALDNEEDSEFYVYFTYLDNEEELFEIEDDKELDDVIETFDTLLDTLGQE